MRARSACSPRAGSPPARDLPDMARLDRPRHDLVAYLTHTALSLDETADVIATIERRGFDHLVEQAQAAIAEAPLAPG